ncbi:MAG: nucleotidyltransferase domain-containing protein [Candidatus Micrarchaeota archaeon]
MISEWEKFKGWAVLEHFLLFPNSKIHINELRRRLKVAPGTANHFCSLYHAEGMLDREVVGNAHLFSLNEKDARVQALKKFIGPYLVSDSMYLKPFLEKNKNILSVAIYGSFATGEYGDKSDLDILVLIADEKRPDTSDLAKIELRLGREIGITPISLAKWGEMERKKDNFFLSIKKKSVLAWGNPV